MRTKNSSALIAALVFVPALCSGIGVQPVFAAAVAKTSSAATPPLKVPEDVMSALLRTRVKPEIPAKVSDPSEPVVIAATVSPDGVIEKLQVISGPQDLRPAAVFAVRQWIYKPYEVNGVAVEVETTITVDFNENKASTPVQNQKGTATAVNSTPSATAKPVDWAATRKAEAKPAVAQAITKPDPVRVAVNGAAPAAATKPAPTYVAAIPVNFGPDSRFTVLPDAEPTQWKLVKRVAPVYPAQAEAEGIEGAVQVEAIIRKDGSTRELKAISGPPELWQAAVDAASQFEYAPADGKRATMEGTTVATVEFLLKGPAKVAPEVMAGRIERSIEPEYPIAAEAAGVTGSVTLHVLIGRQGNLEKADVVSGPPMLRDTALEAVKQWTWKPYLRRGVDVEVDTNVIVAFSLRPADLK